MRRSLLITLMLSLLTVLLAAAGGAASKTLSEDDLLKLLAGGVYNARVVSLVRYRRINFVPTTNDLELLRRAGADEALRHEVLTAARALPQVMQHAPEPPHQLDATPGLIINAMSPTGQNAVDARPAVR
jgi:hypothetical protein